MSRSIDELLDAADELLTELATLDLDAVPVGRLQPSVEQLQQLRCRLDAGEARVLQRWEASRAWTATGAKTAAAWLAWHQHLPIEVARQRLRHARAVRDHAPIEEAWVAGRIDRTHVSKLLSVRTPRTKHAFDRDHEKLLAEVDQGFVAFAAACQRWELEVDPDGAEQGADAERAAREVHLNQSFGGMWFGKMTFDPITGQIVADTLRMIEQELFEADWAAAKERVGRDPMVFELDRTPTQRRADAMAEMAIRARTVPQGGRRPAPLFTVVVGYETLVGPVLELFNRTVITPGTAARWLTEADVERIVFDPPSRVLDVGATRRFFRGALRRAIEVRDRTRFHPSCDEPPARPEIDHIVEASNGGETTQVNGRLGCGFHNRWRIDHPDELWDTGGRDHGDPRIGPDPPPDG